MRNIGFRVAATLTAT